MSISNPAAALAHSFRARGQRVDERIDSLILGGVFASVEEQASALTMCEAPPAPFVSVQVYDPAIGGDVDDSDEFASERSVTITIVKPQAERVAAFIFSHSAAAHIAGGDPATLVLSAELTAREAFESRGLTVGIWDLAIPLPLPVAPIAVSPSKLVRDYVPDREIVRDLSPWLITKQPALDGELFQAWRAQAGRRLLGGLVNSALVESGKTWLQASGPPIFKIEAENPILAESWRELTANTEWVFLSSTDIEARHLISALEIARAYRSSISFGEVLRQALDASRSTYEAHVQSASRETLKALADLRKTVIDETQRVTQRAQDLTGGLWRDVAVSAAPFVLKILGDTTKMSSNGIAAGFYFAAAIFILVSLSLQSDINDTFLKDQKEARTRWFETLYMYISASERKSIAEDPVENAVKAYYKTRQHVGFIYLFLIVILAAFGIGALRQGV
jgi:hypothetical protein